MRKAILFFLITTVFMCCRVGHVPLVMQQEPFTGKQFKTSGYYVALDTSATQLTAGNKKFFLARVMIFYRNGTMFDSNIAIENLNEKQFIDYLMTMKKDNAYEWGIYQVKENIKANLWAPSTGGRHPNFFKDILIVNDTTLKNDGRMYSFRRLHPKPDSVNRYTK